MNNNISLYIGKNGKYSPKMSENRRTEMKNSGAVKQKAKSKPLEWNDIVAAYKELIAGEN